MADHSDRQIRRNVALHDRIARRYDKRHGEIFNAVEQERLAAFLASARDAVRGERRSLEALDVGCGSGNLSRHMLELGLAVTAADVSKGFLALVSARYPSVDTVLMNGRDLSNIADESFDLVATYSVLHHIPDYLAAVAEMARVCRPGGVVSLDHEQNEQFWSGDDTYQRFRQEAARLDWRKYLRPMNYVHRIRRIFNPRHTNEGDIHVWPDDHVEWSAIKQLMADRDFEVVAEDDYLLFQANYRPDVYERYVGRCTDTKAMAFRKRLG